MEIKELDTVIDGLEKIIEIDRKNMEHFIDEFLEAAEIFSINWIKNMINDSVKLEPNITIGMDIGRLKELKSKYQDLLSQIPKIVEKELNDDKTWKHRILLNNSNDELITPYSVLISEIKINIHKHLGRIFGYAGKLLLEFGYYKKHQYKSPWKESYNG